MAISGKAVAAVGVFIGGIAIARLRVLLYRALAANPDEFARLSTAFGFRSDPGESELLIIGYRYAVLRRRCEGVEGTILERERTQIAALFLIFVFSCVVIVAGFVMQGLLL